MSGKHDVREQGETLTIAVTPIRALATCGVSLTALAMGLGAAVAAVPDAPGAELTPPAAMAESLGLQTLTSVASDFYQSPYDSSADSSPAPVKLAQLAPATGAPAPLTPVVVGPAAAPPPPAPGQPRVFESDTVYLEADTLIDDTANQRFIARGSVEARQGARVVRADEVFYYPERGRLVANGNVIVVMENGEIEFADSADISDTFSDGVVLNFATRLANDAVAAAAYVERRNDSQNILTRAVYTACEVCADDPTPSWRLRARKALQDTDEKMIYYRDVTLDVGGIPVVYLPFFAHADPSVQRKTGFLLPAFGYSSITGFRVQQPFFWAINDSTDLTIGPEYRSEVAPILALGLRKRFFSGEVNIEGTLTKEQLFNSSGDKFGEDKLRGNIFGSGVFALSDDWSWGFGVERVSDDQYLLRYGIEETESRRGLYRGENQRLTSQVFLAGQDENFYSTVSAVDFQGLRASDRSGTLPRLLPIAEYRRMLDFDQFGRVELVNDVAVLQRDNGTDYARFTSWADWRARYVTTFGLVMEPFARARGDYYNLQDAFDPITGEEKSGDASRASGFAGLDLRYPFYRPGERINWLFQPQAQFVASAGDGYALADFASGFNDGNPLAAQEDSLTVELDASNLFEPERYPGFDRIEEGLRANYGARLEAEWKGVGTAGVFAGQTVHSDSDSFSVASGLSDTFSDAVLEGDISTRNLTLAARARVDPDDFKLQRFEAEGQLRLWRFALGGTYLDLNQDFTGGTEQRYATGYGSVQVTNNFSASFSFSRDIDLGRTLVSDYGLTYSDDCLQLSVIYSDYNTSDRAIGPTQSVTLYLTLKTLGSFGS